MVRQAHHERFSDSRFPLVLSSSKDTSRIKSGYKRKPPLSFLCKNTPNIRIFQIFETTHQRRVYLNSPKPVRLDGAPLGANGEVVINKIHFFSIQLYVFRKLQYNLSTRFLRNLHRGERGEPEHIMVSYLKILHIF